MTLNINLPASHMKKAPNYRGFFHKIYILLRSCQINCIDVGKVSKTRYT
jgi:hypothetical protein